MKKNINMEVNTDKLHLKPEMYLESNNLKIICSDEIIVYYSCRNLIGKSGLYQNLCKEFRLVVKTMTVPLSSKIISNSLCYMDLCWSEGIDDKNCLNLSYEEYDLFCNYFEIDEHWVESKEDFYLFQSEDVVNSKES